VYKDAKSISQIHNCINSSRSWLGTGTAIKSGGLNWWEKTQQNYSNQLYYFNWFCRCWLLPNISLHYFKNKLIDWSIDWCLRQISSSTCIWGIYLSQKDNQRYTEHFTKLSSSCSTSGTRRATLVTKPMIGREWGKNWEVLTTSGTYPWSFVTLIFHSCQPSHGGDRKIFEVMTST
jgi:hypothetical protein